MAQNKTTETTVDVKEFINSYIDKEEKKVYSFQLLDLMSKWSGFEPRMWGPTIIGFGTYHYKYASGHEGDAPILGFSPRKAEFSLYISIPDKTDQQLLDQLGKFKMAKSCIYVKRLSDIDLEVLEKICKNTVGFMKDNYQWK